MSFSYREPIYKTSLYLKYLLLENVMKEFGKLCANCTIAGIVAMSFVIFGVLIWVLLI